MKTFTHPAVLNLKKPAAFALLTVCTLLLHSCSKKDTPVQEVSFLNIINTSPTPATFNIYLDQNSGRLNQSGAISFGGATGYFQTAPGAHTIKFTTASSTESIITKTISLDASTASSLFLIDKGVNMDFLKIKDELGSVTSDKAFVRFINLSPDATALNLVVKDATDVLIQDKAYKASSAFIEVEPKSYIFYIKDKATGTLPNKELTSIELKAGKSYTVMATGIVTPSGTDQPFRGQIITNQ